MQVQSISFSAQQRPEAVREYQFKNFEDVKTYHEIQKLQKQNAELKKCNVNHKFDGDIDLNNMEIRRLERTLAIA